MLKKGHSFNEALQSFVSHVIEEHSAVIFNGDGYSEAWHKEAVRRGLPDLRNTPEAMPELVKPEVIDLFERMHIMNRDELRAREEIYLGQYSKTIHTEAVLCVRMARTDIYPSGLRYQKELADTCVSLKNLNKDYRTDTLDRITADLRSLQTAADELEKLARHRTLKAVDTRNTVANLYNRAGLARLNAGVDGVELLAQCGVDRLCGDFSH